VTVVDNGVRDGGDLIFYAEKELKKEITRTLRKDLYLTVKELKLQVVETK
jgi:hypothetical protein